MTKKYKSICFNAGKYATFHYTLVEKMIPLCLKKEDNNLINNGTCLFLNTEDRIKRPPCKK